MPSQKGHVILADEPPAWNDLPLLDPRALPAEARQSYDYSIAEYFRTKADRFRTGLACVVKAAYLSRITAGLGVSAWIVQTSQLLEDFGIADVRPPGLYRSVVELDKAGVGVRQVHAMRRAWHDLELDSILCVNGRPSAYFKALPRLDLDTIRTPQSAEPGSVGSRK